jgi:hypothetical protein
MGIMVAMPKKESDLNYKSLKEDLNIQMQNNVREGRIPPNTTFCMYVKMCWDVLEERKRELNVLYTNGNLNRNEYNNDLDFLRQTQDCMKKIDTDNPISVLVGMRI